ncbi:putative porin [Paucibacter oligotrophus]|uniref:Putative porin n=1 Tax=Roseateles oligotrophus TaxID=1769250 RepID=A0A840LDQ2_9BURK|nr:porin [Roseateles oligotrophus]MBB4844752.1 putative porin [Roseateles oligotrophus]
MKKTALILSLLAASTSGAWAQSSVTMYGIVDAGVRYISNSGTAPGTGALWQVVPGGMSQSRLGFNITEDMGGGLKAIANLEHRLNSDTGTVAAADFWRQSWVGLQSSDFGRITVGRQYNVLFDIYTSTYASFKYSPYIEAYKPEIGLSMGARQDNMVKYLFEANGFRGSVQVSAGEGNSNNKSMGGLLRYQAGEFSVGGAYLEVTDLASLKVKGATVGAAWTSGPWYVNASWAQNKFDKGTVLAGAYTAGLVGSGVLNASANDVDTRDMFAVGLTYQLTPQINLGTHYWRASQTHYVSGPNKSNGDYFAAVADYAFSKRTDAYAEFDYTKFSDGYVKFANGAEHRYGATVGIRHRF